MPDIKVIAFDADDTLWINENYFQETQQKFCELLEDFIPYQQAVEELYKTEVSNMPLYGYGVKAFTLSMLETALRVSQNRITGETIRQVLNLGRDILAQPVELLENIREILEHLRDKYFLIVATKGDLLDQKRKLKESQLAHYFEHIEIMSDKDAEAYRQLISKLDCEAENFLMIGNSLKSDILPVLQIGGHAIHIPYSVTWQHEVSPEEITHPNFRKITCINELYQLL